LEIFQYDRDEKIIRRYGSAGLRATRVAAGEGPVHMTCLTVGPGGVIGTHPATASQLFLVVAGEGWVAGPDGKLVVEGTPLALFEPEAPETDP
jgi:hypothetical protein